jgi:hypothetical protein
MDEDVQDAEDFDNEEELEEAKETRRFEEGVTASSEANEVLDASNVARHELQRRADNVTMHANMTAQWATCSEAGRLRASLASRCKRRARATPSRRATHVAAWATAARGSR